MANPLRRSGLQPVSGGHPAEPLPPQVPASAPPETAAAPPVAAPPTEPPPPAPASSAPAAPEPATPEEPTPGLTSVPAPGSPPPAPVRPTTFPPAATTARTERRGSEPKGKAGPKAGDPLVGLSTRIPTSLKKKLKVHAARNDEDIQDLTIRALTELLKREGG